MRKMLDAGNDDYIGKPVKLDELVHKLEKWSDSKKANNEAALNSSPANKNTTCYTPSSGQEGNGVFDFHINDLISLHHRNQFRCISLHKV